jgi:hypothetical protein
MNANLLPWPGVHAATESPSGVGAPRGHCKHQGLEVETLIRACAALLWRARCALDEALSPRRLDRLAAIDLASPDIEGLARAGLELARQALELHRAGPPAIDQAARSRMDARQETLERLIVCACQTLDDLDDAVESCGPSPRQQAAVDRLLGSLRSKKTH